MPDNRDTPTRLIDAAEQLFIAGGEAATSLRAISRAAHANAAAVHYHFGGRDELLRAVFDRHLQPLRVRRRGDVEAVAAGDRAPGQDVVRAALSGDVELLGRLRRRRVDLARFLGRSVLNRGASAIVGEWCGDDFLSYLVGVLRPGLPELRPGEVAERLRLVYAMVCALFATAEEPGADGLLSADDVGEQLRSLSAFAWGALSAGPVRPPGRRGTGRVKPHGARKAAKEASH